ncbi:MAG: SAM-dependent methyltransferase, partial [Burkholderiaceae bacterium]
MENPSSQKSIIALGPWLQTPVGSYVRDWEQACLDKLTVDIFGFKAMQIGMPQINALQANRMPHRWLSDTHLPSGTASEGTGTSPIVVVHDFAELPFA